MQDGRQNSRHAAKPIFRMISAPYVEHVSRLDQFREQHMVDYLSCLKAGLMLVLESHKNPDIIETLLYRME